MISNAELIDVCGRVSELLAREENPCRSWTVFIKWLDGDDQLWTMDYGAHDCDTYDEAAKQVASYITDMPAGWRVHCAWAARATDIVRMDGYRFNRTPQFQVR